MVRCRDGSLYTGITVNLPRRLAAHNSGHGARYTRSRRPVKLVWSRAMRSGTAARKVEYRVKALTKRQKETLVCGGRTERLALKFKKLKS